MIDNEQDAREVAALCKSIVGNLNESLFAMMERLPDSEFAAYRRGVGQIMGPLLEHVWLPVLRRHPHLKPETWDEVPPSALRDSSDEAP